MHEPGPDPSSDGRRYRVLDVLGRGGFGTVYRAELASGGDFLKEVALKVLHPGVEAQPGALARLRDEARVLGLVRHRAIVGVDGLLRLDGRWVVVMEYVHGVALDRLVKDRGPLPVGVALQLVEEVAHALHVAYATPGRDGRPLRLLHRDVKPSNLQLTAAGEVKLLDFGVARAEFDTRESKTGGVIFGSVPYLAPERLEFVDSQAGDLFALGITLVQVIGGRLPPGPSGNPERHAERVEAALDLVRRHARDDALEAFLRRCLAYEPAERPAPLAFARGCADLRERFDGVSLRDWADEVVAPLLEDRDAMTGELSGLVLSEDSSGPRTDLRALAGAVPSTWDDPVGDDPVGNDPVGNDPVGAEASRAAPDDGLTFALPTLDTAPHPSPEAEAAPERRRRPRLLELATLGFLASGGTALLAVAALVGAVLLGTAAVTVAIWPPVSRGGCASMVQEMRDELPRRASGPWVGPTERALADARQRCLLGKGGVVFASLLRTTWDGLLEDGELSEADHRHLVDTIEAWTGDDR